MLKITAAYCCLGTALFAGEFTSLIATELAAVTMRPIEAVVQKVPRSQCSVCKGTGQVKAGDTVTVVWHECENCYDDSHSESPAAQVQPAAAVLTMLKAVDEAGEPPAEHSLIDGGKSRRVLMFTASWCAPCQIVKGDLLPWKQTRTKQAALTALKSTGWTIGQAPSNQFQLIDVDDHPELMERFGVQSLPTFILLLDGQEIARETGAIDQWKLAELYQRVPDEAVEPGAFLQLGSLEDVRPRISELKRILQLLGEKGTLELRPEDAGPPLNIAVSSTTSIQLALPFKLRYEVNGETVSLIFDTPPPVRYRFLKGSLTEVEIATDRITVKLKGLPDAYFQIKS